MRHADAQQNLTNRVEAQPTDTLLTALKTIDAKPWADKTQEERLVSATICDVITERHNLGAKIDELYEALPLEEHLTFYEAILKAMDS